MALPEIARQLFGTGVEQVAVFQRLVVEIILRRQPQCARLDAHVDVFADQNHRHPCVRARQMHEHGKDVVVAFGGGQRSGQRLRDGVGLEKQRARRLPARCVMQRDARAHVGATFNAADNGVQHPAGLTRIAGDFGQPFFVGIQLFERHHGDVQIVLFKAEQAGRVVHQHVGIEHKQFAGAIRHGRTLRQKRATHRARTASSTSCA